MILQLNSHDSNDGARSHTTAPTKGDDNNNNKANDNKINSTSTSSYYKELSDIPRRSSTKRQRTVSFKSQFEQIFMDAENHNEILELFDKKELTLTEKKHIDTVVQAFVSREFPTAQKYKEVEGPTIKNLIHIGESRAGKNQPRYIPGEWVEVLGNDAKWRLRIITRVVKQVSSEYHWKMESSLDNEKDGFVYSYHAGVEKNLPEHRLRAPQDGLKALFGLRPWLWQQWAMLKLEEKLRFQENHQDDFMIMSAQRYAIQMWSEWLDHPKNQDFKVVFDDDRIGDFGRAELLDHILYPFVMIDQLTSNDGEWNLQNDTNFSVYTYQSLTGAYFHLTFVVFLIQLTIPAILAYDVTMTFVECSQSQAYQPQNEFIRVTLIIILIFYSMTLIPDILFKIYNVFGNGDSAYSRLLAFRRRLWMYREDRLMQRIGFKLDIYMNTAYDCILAMLNIYVISRTQSPLDIVLNALAFFFIASMDQSIAHSEWFDPKKRHLIAGVVEVVIQSVLRTSWLNDPELFAANFHVPLNELAFASDRETRFLNDAGLASLDEEDVTFMDKKTRLRFFCLRAARKLRNTDGIAEYARPLAFPDVMTRILSSRYNAIFERHFSFRTWSRWEHVLFLPKLPDIMFLLGKMSAEEPIFKKAPLGEGSLCRQRNRFKKYIKGVFMFKALKKVLHNTGKEIKLFFFSFHMIETVIEMGILLIPLLFIFFFLLIFILSLYNLFRDKCISISEIFG